MVQPVSAPLPQWIGFINYSRSYHDMKNFMSWHLWNPPAAMAGALPTALASWHPEG